METNAVPFNDSPTEFTVHLLVLIYVIIYKTKHSMSFIYILHFMYFCENMYCFLAMGTVVCKQILTFYLNVNSLCKWLLRKK